jgi:biopolymer transport protein ExbB
MIDQFNDLLRRGGPIMWPLLGLSLLGVMLCVERCWFWLRTNHPGRPRALARMARLLRQGDIAGVKALIDGDTSIYGRVVQMLLDEQVTDAVATEAVESQRYRLERFMPTLSTIITAAPMLGILGTVTGIIASFNILSDETTTDPRAVSAGIAEALLTTAVGLVVALVVLFPYNAYRAQIDRTLARIEALVAAAMRRKPSQDSEG